MAEKNLVEEALIQIQNLEEAINENAKEILHSTMKEEISELVKESMKNEAEEEDEFEVETDVESDEDDSEEEDYDSEEEDYESEEEDSEEDDSEEDFNMSNFSDISVGNDFESDEVMDLSNHSLEDVLKAYKQMSPDDSFEIKKEGDFIHLKDEEDEYLIQTESEEDEIEMDGMTTMEEYSEFDESEEEEKDEIVYEIEMGDEAEEEEDETEKGEFDENEEEEYEFDEDVVYESKSSIKPKVGPKVKLGDAKKSIYTKTAKGGFNEKKSHANPTKGTSKPKFEFKEGEMFEMPSPKGVKKYTKEEAKEAARTYGFGSKEGRGLRKGVTPNRNLTFENREIMEEVEMLKAKNEEYRKALNMFRDKLNEVAVFNSNLAYATRLFTEHSTSKQEKINVLRRFDSAETLKESKALYRTIKEELSGNNTKTQMTESIERVIEKTPQSGSAVNLIESKTYENPQFLRMKDIMSKIIK
jgi:hypothetical protein